MLVVPNEQDRLLGFGGWDLTLLFRLLTQLWAKSNQGQASPMGLRTTSYRVTHLRLLRQLLALRVACSEPAGSLPIIWSHRNPSSFYQVEFPTNAHGFDAYFTEL